MKIRLFDTCILGNSVGGLIAALMLQKQKAKVLVLQQKVEFEPELCEFLNGFSLKPALKRMGFHPAEVNAIPPLEAPIQLIFPEHRLDCYGDEQRFEQELAREFPNKAKQISQLFRESYGRLEIFQHILNSRIPVPPRGFFAKRQFRKSLEQVCDMQLLEDRSMEKEIKNFDIGNDFGRAIGSMRMALCQLVSDWTSGAQLAHLLTLVRWEGYQAPEGVLTLQKLLKDRIKERGGVLVDCEQIREALIKRNQISGFALKGSEFDEIGCSTLVVAGDPNGLIALSPDAKKMRNWKNEIEQLELYAVKAYQTFRLALAGIPIGMKSQGMLIPGGLPEGEPEKRKRVRAIRYVIRQVIREGKPPEIWLGLTIFLPPKIEQLDMDRIREEIRILLRSVMVFMDRYLLEEPSPLYIPAIGRKPGDLRQGSIYSSEKPRELAVSGIGPETPFDNVFMAGDMVFPGLGLDGEIIAGLQATHYAGAMLKKDPVAA